MEKRKIRKNKTLYKWLITSLQKHGLTLTSKNLTPDEYRILRNYYNKYNQKCIKEGIISGWNGYVK